MQEVYFQTDTSGPRSVYCTDDGRIDFSALAEVFGLDLTSIQLNGSKFPRQPFQDKTGPISEFKWEKIEAKFKEKGFPLGTIDAPVRVTGAVRHSDSAKLPAVKQGFQLFVESARRSYEGWEKEFLKVKKNLFMEVKGDPFDKFSGAFLIWVRKCYVRLKDTLVKEAEDPGQRFILLGTAGIGKSFFTIFWVCYLATQKKRVVWKVDGLYYLLDFSQDVATVHGPLVKTAPQLVPVLNDAKSWLIIDGGQKTRLSYGCSILLACSDKKENHHEFSKSGRAKTWYLPVWAEVEITGFCDAFEEQRSKFSNMDVPDKDTALANFEELGGVPRFVLRADRMQHGRARLEEAINFVRAENCMAVYTNSLDTSWSDRLIHMFVDDEGDYTEYTCDFACSAVRHSIEQQLKIAGKQQILSFLEQSINSAPLASLWGQVYEHAVHVILSQGGRFKRKRVSENGGGKEDTFKQQKLDFEDFVSYEDLPELKRKYRSRGAYCQPLKRNFESVDAIIVPGTLVQAFKYRTGNHGYKVNGLKKLDEALKAKKYSLWSCVPREFYEETGFQKWVTTKGSDYQDFDEEVVELLRKMTQYVVEVDYREYRKQNDR